MDRIYTMGGKAQIWGWEPDCPFALPAELFNTYMCLSPTHKPEKAASLQVEPEPWDLAKSSPGDSPPPAARIETH